METFHGKNDTQSKHVHGYDGPLQACAGHVNQGALDSFTAASKKVLGASYADAEDANDFTTTGNQISGWKKWMYDFRTKFSK